MHSQPFFMQYGLCLCKFFFQFVFKSNGFSWQKRRLCKLFKLIEEQRKFINSLLLWSFLLFSLFIPLLYPFYLPLLLNLLLDNLLIFFLLLSFFIRMNRKIFLRLVVTSHLKIVNLAVILTFYIHFIVNHPCASCGSSSSSSSNPKLNSIGSHTLFQTA